MSCVISLIVCTHNRYDVIDGAVKSIESQDLAPDAFELIIVDNSTNRSAQSNYLSKLDLLCRNQIIVEQTPGLSRARNIGVRAAKAPIVAFIDDDARAAPNWASEIVASFRRHPNAGIVGGPVRPIWPTQRPAWIHPWLEGFLTIVDRGASERALDEHEWLAGTNIAFQREVLLQCGLFEEQLGRVGRMLLSNEELSVTRNVRRSGHSVIYNPAAEVQHIVHRDRIDQNWFRRRVFWQAISDMFDHDDIVSFERRIDTVLDYLERLRPRDRGLTGVFRTIDDAESFHAQTMAITSLVHLLANDARDWREYLDVKAT